MQPLHPSKVWRDEAMKVRIVGDGTFHGTKVLNSATDEMIEGVHAAVVRIEHDYGTQVDLEMYTPELDIVAEATVDSIIYSGVYADDAAFPDDYIVQFGTTYWLVPRQPGGKALKVSTERVSGHLFPLGYESMESRLNNLYGKLDALTSCNKGFSEHNVPSQYDDLFDMRV
jgi:hypothetical protein